MQPSTKRGIATSHWLRHSNNSGRLVAVAPLIMLTYGAVPGRLPGTIAHSSLLPCRPCSEKLQLPCQAWSRSLQLSKKTWLMSTSHPPQPKRAARVLPPLSVPADDTKGASTECLQEQCVSRV